MLLDLACKNLDRRLRRRVGPDDIVQRTFKSFFLRHQRGQYDLADRKDLLRLLVTMTLNKARGTAAKESRGRRDFRREQTAAATMAIRAGQTRGCSSGRREERRLRTKPRRWQRRPSEGWHNCPPTFAESRSTSWRDTRTRRSQRCRRWAALSGPWSESCGSSGGLGRTRLTYLGSRLLCRRQLSAARGG